MTGPAAIAAAVAPRVNADDPFAAARADIDQRLAKFLEGVDIIEKRGELDDATAARANDFIAGAKRLLAEAETARKAEKAPHLAAAKAVDQSWDAIRSRIERVIGVVRPMLDRYLKRKDDERRAAEAEARRKAEEAEAARRAAEADAIAAQSASARIEAEERARENARLAEEAAAEAAKAKEPVRVESATGLTRRRSLTTVRKPAITSLATALAHYKDEPELAELIVKFAARDLRAAPTVRGKKQIPVIPGIQWVESQELT